MSDSLASRPFALFRTVLFALTFMGTTGVYLPIYLGLLRRSPALDARLLGILPLTAGAYIALRCAFEFAWRGRGTPAPFDAPIHLVATGMYRYVRNPMYLGMGLLLVGEWLIWGSHPRAALTYLGVCAGAVLLFVVGYEEPALTKKFGDDYREYRRNVRRFLPRLTPWGPQKAKSAVNSE